MRTIERYRIYECPDHGEFKRDATFPWSDIIGWQGDTPIRHLPTTCPWATYNGWRQLIDGPCGKVATFLRWEDTQGNVLPEPEPVKEPTKEEWFAGKGRI